MNTYISLYEILGLQQNANTEDVKHAFRRLALIHHPDKNNNSPQSQAVFIELRHAFEVLTDPIKRAEYDGYLAASAALKEWQRTAAKKPLTLPDLGGTLRPYEALLTRFNYLLWDIEDFVDPRRGRNFPDPVFAENLLFKTLIFIDKWVLTPFGFPDYFAAARRMNGIDPALYAAQTTRSETAHSPFVNLADYFYNIRKRMNQFLEKTRPAALLKALPGSDIRLADCLIEAENYTVHCLSCLMAVKQGAYPDIGAFVHSRAEFEV